MAMRGWVGGAAVVAVVAAGCGDDGTAVQMWAEPSAVDALVRVDWGMDAITVAGERRAVDPTYGAVLRFDGDGRFTGTTCNQWGGTVTISDDRLEWGDEMSSTAMGCDGDRAALELDVTTLVTTDATWAIDGDRLRIEGGDIVLELTRLADAFPTPGLEQIAASEPGAGVQWQIGYASGVEPPFLTWEGREAPGEPWGSAGMAVDPVEPIDGMALPFAGQTMVLGYVPAGTTTAAYEVAGAAPAPLDLHELPGGRLVVGALVPQGAGAIVARDAAGTELGRTRELPGGAYE